LHRRNRRHTYRELQQELEDIFNIDLSTRSIRRGFKKLGIRRCKAVRKPFLNATNKRKRRVYARKFSNLDTTSVVATDETQILNDTGRVWVSRAPHEREREDCLAPAFRKFKGFMAWAAVWHGGRSPLVRLDLSKSTSKRKGFNSDLYINQVYKQHLRRIWRNVNSSWRAYGGAWLLEDNSGIHMSKKSRAAAKKYKFRNLPHPPNSPDLNPIENVWAFLKYRLRSLKQRPKNLDELYEAADAIWRNIPQRFINDLMRGMRKRLRLVKLAHGGHIRY